MTKIKNFRITLRPREIVRWLKKERGFEVTPELELSAEQLTKDGKGWIVPAAVYTTLTRGIAEKTTPITFPDKSIAVSVVAVSIGTALNLARVAAESDSIREPLLAALHHEALAQAVQFAVRLIEEQAKEEDCEISAPVIVQDNQAASSLATLVGVQKIGIAMDSTVPQLPSHTRVAWIFWTPMGKGSSRRAESAKRAEKIAA